MTKFSIIGGRSGLGRAIAEHYSISHVLGQPEYDISTSLGIEAIQKEIRRAAPNVVILNGRSVIKPAAQLDLFEALWMDWAVDEITFVVISSYARVFAGVDVGDEGFQVYAKAKKALSERALRLGYRGKPKVIVIEPSYVVGGVPHDMTPFLTTQEFLETIDQGLELSKSSQVVSITRVGSHK